MFSGENLITRVPRPRLDRLAMIPAEEPGPTSSEEYSRAASIQKKNPKKVEVREFMKIKRGVLVLGT